MLVTAGPKPRAARRPQVSTSQEPESSPQTLEDVLRGKRLVVVVGNGGVGKTSTSAAIACARARRGEDVGVLTIDPAPRLGDALGLSGLEETPRHVALPSPSLGQLRAMRLDSKGTLDRMVDRYADSPTAALALRQHPIYLALAGQLGGAENYAAFQRLHELVEDGLYDCLVVDTPPALHASDLLAAPARLSSLMGGSALSFLADPARVAARAGGTLARATVSLVLAAVERVTGTSLQKELSRFVELFTGLASGLERRTRDIDRLLRDPSTAFVLVTRPRRRDIQEALRFRESLAKAGIEVAGIVVNRLTPAAGATPKRSVAARSSLTPELLGAIAVMEAEMNALRALEDQAMADLREALAEVPSARRPAPSPVFLLRARDADVESLVDIVELAESLGA